MSREPRHLLKSPEEGEILLPAPAQPCAGGCRWLISLDYDGTLRRPGETGVQPDFFETIRALRRSGVRWGINTGRSLEKLAGELEGFPLMPDFFCTCERYVYLANESGSYAPASAHNALCHRANMELRQQMLPTWRAALQRLRERFPALQWDIAADDPLSIEAQNSDTLDALMPFLEPFAGRWAAIQRAGRFMRLSDARFNKGSALRYVQQIWQVDEAHLLLMGDGHNDLDAFRHFPRAFCACPATAHPTVTEWLQKHGGYISPAAGVLETLQRWGTRHGLLPTPPLCA